MPAVSKAQRKLFGLALAVKRGEVDASTVDQKIRDLSKKKEQDLKDYAETPEETLPNKLEDSVDEATYDDPIKKNAEKRYKDHKTVSITGVGKPYERIKVIPKGKYKIVEGDMEGRYSSYRFNVTLLKPMKPFDLAVQLAQETGWISPWNYLEMKKDHDRELGKSLTFPRAKTLFDESVDENAELQVGTSVEMEHTDDPNKAETIAKDHLAEDPNYYSKLYKAGLIDEPAAIQLAKSAFESVNEDLSQKLNNELGSIRGTFAEEDINQDDAEFYDIKPGKYIKFYIEDVNNSTILKVKRIAKANGLKFAKDLDDMLLFTESVNEAKLDQYTVLVWQNREKTWDGEDDMQLPPSFKSISQAKDYANKKHQEDKNYAWAVHDEKNNKNVFVVGNIDESVNEAKKYEWDDILDVLMTISGTGKILNKIKMDDPEVEELLDAQYKSYPDFAKAIKSIYNLKENHLEEAIAYAEAMRYALEENSTAATPGSVNGMGNVSLPGNPGTQAEFSTQETGSGDLAASSELTDEDDEDEGKKIYKFLKFNAFVGESLNEATQYITDGFKVGDKIKTGFGEWEVLETDYKPGKSFTGSFMFKGKDMKRVNIPNPPKTNKAAVGYKVTDGDKYPIIGFLYQYKDITKLATVGVDESINEGFEWWQPLLALAGSIGIVATTFFAVMGPGMILNPHTIASGDGWGDVLRHYKKKFKDKKTAKKLKREDVLELINLIQTNIDSSDLGPGVKKYIRGLMNNVQKELNKGEGEVDKNKLLVLLRDVEKYAKRKGIKVDESVVNEGRDDVTFTLDDGDLDDKFLSDKSLSRNLDYKKDGRDTYYVLPKRDFDRLQDWADSSGYDTDEVIYVVEESINESFTTVALLIAGLFFSIADIVDTPAEYHFQKGTRMTGPALDKIKNIIKDRKIKSIVKKLKDDPELIKAAQEKTPGWQNMLMNKLDPKDQKYIKSIYRRHITESLETTDTHEQLEEIKKHEQAIYDSGESGAISSWESFAKRVIGKDGQWKDAPAGSYTDAVRELKSIMTKYSIKA